jgi:uncharacterized protein YcbK (DUF882 family)
MSVSRRKFLCMSAGAAFVSAAAVSVPRSAFASPALVGLKKLNIRTLAFDCTNTGETLDPIDYWVEGKYVPDALDEINDALRDYRTGEVYPIATRLLDLLHGLGTRLETGGRFELTSGYRSPETNAALHELDSGVASNSLHMKGLAADISVPDRDLRDVYETALAMRMGGVGYYPDPDDDFIHLDVGRVRRWEG